MTSRKPSVKEMLQLPLQQNRILIYWPSPTPSLEQSPLWALWGAVSQAAVIIVPPIKLNLQLSHCASLFSWHMLTKWILHEKYSILNSGLLLIWLSELPHPPKNIFTASYCLDYYKKKQFSLEATERPHFTSSQSPKMDLSLCRSLTEDTI